MAKENQEANIWDELRKPFPKEVVGLLPKPTTKDGRKGTCSECGKYHQLPAVHLDYVGHAAVTDRLNNVAGVDNWNWQPLASDESGLPLLDRAGNLWIKLTINGVTKIGVGDGKNAKEIIGDALRNAAMRFGVALDLWSKEELESTIDQPELKNEKPTSASSPQPKPAISKPAANYNTDGGEAQTGKKVTPSQGKLLLARARDFSGLQDWDEIRTWFVDIVGIQPNDVLMSDMDDVMAVLEQARQS